MKKVIFQCEFNRTHKTELNYSQETAWLSQVREGQCTVWSTGQERTDPGVTERMIGIIEIFVSGYSGKKCLIVRNHERSASGRVID